MLATINFPTKCYELDWLNWLDSVMTTMKIRNFLNSLMTLVVQSDSYIAIQISYDFISGFWWKPYVCQM